MLIAEESSLDGIPQRTDDRRDILAIFYNEPFGAVEKRAEEQDHRKEQAGPRQPQFCEVKGMGENISGKDPLETPSNGPEGIPEHECSDIHLDAAGDEWHHLFQAWYKSPEKDTFGSMLIHEMSAFFKVIWLNEPDAVLEPARTESLSERVIYIIADDRPENGEPDKITGVEIPPGGQRAKDEDYCRTGKNEADPCGCFKQSGKKSDPIPSTAKMFDRRQYMIDKVIEHDGLSTTVL